MPVLPAVGPTPATVTALPGPTAAGASSEPAVLGLAAPEALSWNAVFALRWAALVNTSSTGTPVVDAPPAQPSPVTAPGQPGRPVGRPVHARVEPGPAHGRPGHGRVTPLHTAPAAPASPEPLVDARETVVAGISPTAAVPVTPPSTANPPMPLPLPALLPATIVVMPPTTPARPVLSVVPSAPTRPAAPSGHLGPAAPSGHLGPAAPSGHLRAEWAAVPAPSTPSGHIRAEWAAVPAPSTPNRPLTAAPVATATPAHPALPTPPSGHIDADWAAVRAQSAPNRPLAAASPTPTPTVPPVATPDVPAEPVTGPRAPGRAAVRAEQEPAAASVPTPATLPSAPPVPALPTTPVAAAPATATPAAIRAQVVTHVRPLVDSGAAARPDGASVDVVLSPAGLGRVAVRAHLVDGTLRVEVRCGTAETTAALRTTLDDLRHELAATGHEAVVAVSHRPEPPAPSLVSAGHSGLDGRAGSTGQDAASGGGHSGAPARASPPAPDRLVPAVPHERSARRPAAGTGGLDLMA